MSIDYVYQNYTIMIFGGESIDSLSGAIQKANGSLKKYLISLDAAKVKTLALKAATVAFEAALTLGITWAISKLIEAYDKFAHAEERLLEQQKQARQQIVENVKAYNDEVNESKDLSASYIELVSTTSDLTSEKEKLLEIQEKINKGIEDQTDKVDLLNKSLSENIELTSKQRLEEAKKVVSENQATYENIIKGENASYNAMQTYGDRDVAKAISEIEYATGKRISGKLKEQSQQLEEILELYRNIDGYNKQYYNDVVKGKQAIDAQLNEWTEVKSVVDDARKTIQELTISPETQKAFNGLIDKTKQLYDELSNATGTSQKFNLFGQLEDVRSELYELVGNNSELSQIVDNLFASFEAGFNSISDGANSFSEVWFNTLDDMQKGVFANIDKIKSAMQSLAEGGQLSSGDFWDLMKLDTDRIVTDIQMVGDKYIVNQEQLIKLKDQIVQRELESLRIQKESSELNRQDAENLVNFLEQQKVAWKFAEKPLTNIQYRKEYDELNTKLEQAKIRAKEYGDAVYRDTILEKQLAANLGDTVDMLKALTAQQKQLNDEISALNKQLDNYVNAYNSIIDSRIDGLQDEVDVLEEQKGILEDELDALNEQKDSLEQIINDYQSINSIVQDTVQKEIDSLNEQKKAIEDTYNKRIEALKTENEEREDALEYAQKLANLENAKNNKVRVIDATRGFRYESVKEDVVQAENDLKSFETEQAIKKLESERDTEAKVFDDLIKQREEYAELWQNGIDSIQEAQNDLLMSEKYGADWREKIAAGDTEILDTFILNYREHNDALKNLTDNEIKMKQAAIATKNAEIDSKKKQIKSWQDYKTQVSKAIQTLKGDQSEYKGIIEDLERTEPLTLETRGNAFETFKTRISGYISEIGSKQGVLNDITSTIDSLSGGDYQFNFEVNNLDVLKETRDVIEDIAAAAGYLSVTSMSSEELQNKWITDSDFTTADYVQELLRRRGRSHADGGVADYTGLAMLHGRKNAPETIFNANDSAKLYEMVHNTPNLMADMIDKATKISGFNLANASNNTQNSNEYSFYIDKIVTDNPQDFAKQLDRYYQTKLTESYTNK